MSQVLVLTWRFKNENVDEKLLKSRNRIKVELN